MSNKFSRYAFKLNSFTELPKRKLGQIYHEPHTQITHASPIQSQGAASRKLIIGTRSSITRVMSGARRAVRLRPSGAQTTAASPPGRGHCPENGLACTRAQLHCQPSRFLN